MTDFQPLRWLLVFLFSLLWATMGGAAALAEHGDFGHCTFAANKLPPGASSLYKDVTRAGSRYANRATDVTAADFQANLVSSGYNVVKTTVGKNGPVTVLSNRTNTYTVYTRTSTGASGAQLTDAAGNILVKISLK